MADERFEPGSSRCDSSLISPLSPDSSVPLSFLDLKVERLIKKMLTVAVPFFQTIQPQKDQKLIRAESYTGELLSYISLRFLNFILFIYFCFPVFKNDCRMDAGRQGSE